MKKLSRFFLLLLFLLFWNSTAFSDSGFQADKIPPLLLKAFRTTRDIRYSQFMVPTSTMFSRFSFSLVLDKSCLPENFTIVLRPHSLPIVSPFGFESPPSAVILPDFYAINIGLNDNPFSEILISPPNEHIGVCTTRNGLFVSIESTVLSPIPGLWYFGALFTDNSFEKECQIFVFVQILHKLAPSPLHTIIFRKTSRAFSNVSSASVHPHRRSVSLESVNVFNRTQKSSKVKSVLSAVGQQHGDWTRFYVSTGHPNIHSRSSYRSNRISHARSLGVRSQTNSIPLVPHTTEYPSKFIPSEETSCFDGFGSSFINLHLKPYEGQLVRLVILFGMTSLEMSLKSCQPSSNIQNGATSPSNASRLAHIRERRRNTVTKSTTDLCKLAFETSISSLPISQSSTASGYDFNQTKIKPTDSYSLNGSTPSTSHCSRSRPSSKMVYWKHGRQYRFEDLQAAQLPHYLYLQNLHTILSLDVIIAFTPLFGCDTDDQATPANQVDHPPVRETVQQLDTVTNETENEPTSNSLDWTVSLLPWLNASWPELTPEKGRRRLMRQTPADDASQSATLGVTNPHDPAHQLLYRCVIWSAPSRISMPHAFSSHFTYQPNSGRYTSGFQLQAWHVVALPIQLDPQIDSGGTLEISLQLNAFAVTRLVNRTHSQPLLRQIILHGCFARHVTVTPFGFVNPRRCPLWLRLATDRGLAISVAHAVSIVASNVFSRSQPPHRSEVPPTLNTSFDDQVDRSFFYLPYPSPGQWYLSLYAECYPVHDVLCSQAPAASIDVGLVMRLTPCLNYRCRDSGEGASLPPSRVLNVSLIGVRPLIERPQPILQSERWRPPWWIPGLNASNPRQSPLVLPPSSPLSDDRPSPGEGLCVELLQRTIFAATCACPPGRAGLGCVRFPPSVIHHANRSLSALSDVEDGLDYMWTGHSSDALLLALSNLAFLPAIGLSLMRRLWIPAVAYTYTLVFSALYHICDTDVMNIPLRVGANTIGGTAMSFGGYALPKSRGYKLLGSEPSGYRSTSPGFRFTSPTCPLPPDVLSFCDFFGGVLSVWVTIVAATACPLRYAQLAYVMFVLSLTVAVQVARYSTGLFLIPCLVGMVMLIGSWTYQTRRTGHLFPPVQWWLVSFFPGLLLAGIGLILFLSPSMGRDYARMHSLWHIVIGLSPLGLLPWPGRWRIALANVVPDHTPLSCGGDQHNHPRHLRRAESIRTGRSRSPSCDPLNGGKLEGADPVSSKSRLPAILWSIRRCGVHVRYFACRVRQCARVWTDKLDMWLELDRILDPLVARWPKLDWLLPNGYIPGRSRNQTKCSNSLLRTTIPGIPPTLESDSNPNEMVPMTDNHI